MYIDSTVVAVATATTVESMTNLESLETSVNNRNILTLIYLQCVAVDITTTSTKLTLIEYTCPNSKEVTNIKTYISKLLNTPNQLTY
jgi:hypothetical protein